MFLSVYFTLVIKDECDIRIICILLISVSLMICFSCCKTCAIVIGLLKATYLLTYYRRQTDHETESSVSVN